MADKEEMPEQDFFKRLEEVEDLWIESEDHFKKLKSNITDSMYIGTLAVAMAASAIKKNPDGEKEIEAWKSFISKRDDINPKIKEALFLALDMEEIEKGGS